jgi:dipeptidase
VPHTFAYYDSNYAVQSECGLMFGESTGSAVFKAFALGTAGGTALFSVNELTRVAAERTCSARGAVQLMGALAEQYGFYGADGGAGEVLMVGDRDEAFVFHILSDPTGTSAIWIAQRVADTDVAVVANMFSIREVDLADSHTFLASSNLLTIATEYPLWDGVGTFDFTRVYSGGEYTAKYYTGRRVWDGFRRFKPSLALPAQYGSLKNDVVDNPWGRSAYPFSVTPDRKLALADVFAAHRSHYEGTPYDMTRGLAAGPFGNPDRYGVPGVAYDDPGVGSWERSVGIYRTSVTWVVTCRPPPTGNGIEEGTVWWAPGDSAKVRAAAPPSCSAALMQRRPNSAPPRPSTAATQRRRDPAPPRLSAVATERCRD